MVTREINVLALVKGDERYVFIYDDDNRVEMLRQLGRFAANPELSFTWYDAAVMSQRVRQSYEERSKETPKYELRSRFSLRPDLFERLKDSLPFDETG
ncbi:MAG: hypothetical protein PHF67_03475 [Candidatus Nanoarchaeia archaeon]|nr:hypothetical protein [Candidatus Nanoarchaeia archaeon]